MRNLNYPHQQALYEDARALLADRYDAVVERLLYPEADNIAFMTAIHEELANAYCYYLSSTGPSVIKQRKSMADTLSMLEREEQDIRDIRHRPTQEEVDLGVVRTLAELFDSGEPDTQVRRMVDFGILAARNKPDQGRVNTVLRRPSLDTSMGDKVFRIAVEALQGNVVWLDELAAIEQSLPKLQKQLHIEHKRQRAANTINRFYRGRLARQVLERLLDPGTTRRDVIDEITVIRGAMPAPFAPPPEVIYDVPVEMLSWPILPPGEGEPRQESEVSARSVGEEQAAERHRDKTRTEWIHSLAGRWALGGEVKDVDLHNAGQDPNEYKAAVLQGPDGSVFAVIADTDIAVPHHGLFAAITRRLQNKQGKSVHWRVPFRSAKNKAQNLGVRRFNHTGQDFYARVMDYVCDAYIEQFGEEPVIRNE